MLLSPAIIDLSTPYLVAQVAFFSGPGLAACKKKADRDAFTTQLALYKAHLALRPHSLKLADVRPFVSKHVHKYHLRNEARGEFAFYDMHEDTMFSAAEAVINQAGGQEASLEAIAYEWSRHPELEDFVLLLIADRMTAPQ